MMYGATPRTKEVGVDHSEAIAGRLRKEIRSLEDQLSRLREALAAIEGKERVATRSPDGRRRRRGRPVASAKRSSVPVSPEDIAPVAAAEPGAYLTEAATVLNRPRRGARRARAVSSGPRREQ
jgi:hypothetical protein